MELDKEDYLELYRVMVRIRKFEQQATDSFEIGDIPGMVHLSMGQEATEAGACSVLKKTDYITSTHRGHGHMIAKGGKTDRMMAELCARRDGYCRGKGGSMHISSIEIGMLGADGMVGAGMPIATGAALASWIRGTDDVTVCFFGDGASNEGLFHECLNFAALKSLPVVFLCENNLYAISTSTKRSMKVQDVASRAAGYGIPGVIVDGNDVLAVREATSEAVARARRGEGPTLIEAKTYKHHGHFEGDPADYRPQEEVQLWLDKDPIPRYARYLVESGIAVEGEIAAIDGEIAAEIAKAVEFALASEPLDSRETCMDVYSDIVEEGR
ncbi:MAG: thiamine pyrophosphate-dependent dehydrogenase E1 component subunit alpha [Clostridia bacterium]|nr:thiamine pyrophosphate-dependent dehydrogenase E1 component subunit alpha [Clostridia bacterium]